MCVVGSRSVSAETHGAECKTLAAGAGSLSSRNSLIDGSGAPPFAAGLRAAATSVTGLSAGCDGGVDVSVGRSGVAEGGGGGARGRGVAGLMGLANHRPH